MRAVGYTRVSTLDQSREGVSLEAQRARIAAWCQAQGYDLAPEAIHVDAGISGKRSDNRPALQAALGSACSGPSVLVVYSLSRLARSTADAIAIAERINRAGSDLVSLTENIDTRSATGKLTFHLFAALAQFERDLVAERTLMAMAYKRGRGERLGQIPYGSKLAEDGRTLEPDPRDIQFLASIETMRLAGFSLRQIATWLNRARMPAKNGGNWSHSSVAAVLRSAKSPSPQEPAP